MNKVKFPSCNKVQRKQSKGMPFVVIPYFEITQRDIT